MSSCGSSLFGPSSQYIKVNGGDFIAIEGANTFEKLIVSDLRMPYKQLLKSRIILKPGQVNYLLNHLGIGDNATFLCAKIIYNSKSVIEDDNYINWSFYDDLTKVYSVAQMLVLTGNSTNRIKQLYLTNPNTKYSVSIDVMIGVIDDNYSFFNDTLSQSGTTFTNLEYTDIKSHIIGESFKINDKGTPVRALIYLQIVNIETIEKSGNILIIDDASYGTIFLQFLTDFDAFQAHSLLNYIIENPNIDISTINLDNIDPVITFYTQVYPDGDLISFNNEVDNAPYNTSNGLTFSTSISISEYGTMSGTLIDKSQLIYLLIDNVSDNRDGTMSLMQSNININNINGVVENITQSGTYSLTFNFSDIAHNQLDGVHVDLIIFE